MADHPYKSLPAYCFWRASVAKPPLADIDPVVEGKFKIAPTDRVVTAGSCFAQHIARHLVSAGFNFHVTETPHPLVAQLDVARYGYGVFSARYGNVYTSRQLVQLIKRAYGSFVPDEDVWAREDGRWVDPFRPQIQPHGFSSPEELRLDRAHHLSAVRRAIEELDVFVFTFGLTEAWLSRSDGAAYPICPGVAGGNFDEAKYTFVNLNVLDVKRDMEIAIDLIRAKNPRARFVLTVSPVPLIATVEDKSVIVSTTYSKSVLRVVAEELTAARSYVAYFPSYEIITGNFTRGQYYAEDLREVTAAGVEHVMRLFMKHYADLSGVRSLPAIERDPTTETAEGHLGSMQKLAAVICDEEALDPRSAQQAAA